MGFWVLVSAFGIKFQYLEVSFIICNLVSAFGIKLQHLVSSFSLWNQASAFGIKHVDYFGQTYNLSEEIHWLQVFSAHIDSICTHDWVMCFAVYILQYDWEECFLNQTTLCGLLWPNLQPYRRSSLTPSFQLTLTQFALMTEWCVLQHTYSSVIDKDFFKMSPTLFITSLYIQMVILQILWTEFYLF